MFLVRVAVRGYAWLVLAIRFSVMTYLHCNRDVTIFMCLQILESMRAFPNDRIIQDQCVRCLVSLSMECLHASENLTSGLAQAGAVDLLLAVTVKFK